VLFERFGIEAFVAIAVAQNDRRAGIPTWFAIGNAEVAVVVGKNRLLTNNCNDATIEERLDANCAVPDDDATREMTDDCCIAI